MNNKVNGMQRMNARKMANTISNPRKSVFAGDPISIDPEVAGAPLKNDIAADEVTEAAVVDTAPTPEVAAEKVAALDTMTVEEKARVTLVPPLAVDNASIIVNPVTKGLSASNLNFQLEQALMLYPIKGFVKTASGAGPENETILSIDGSELSVPNGDVSGIKVIPFLRLNISASSLNARNGANYDIYMRFSKPGAPDTIIETDTYTVQRRSSTEPILCVYVPFETVATRTLAALAAFGTPEEGEAPIVAEVIVRGMQPEEVLTATIPGYTTGELRKIAESYNLPAGFID